MAPLADLRLAVMTFVQRWDAATHTLRANVLLVPSVDPIGIPLVGSAAAFADRLPVLNAVVIGSLDGTPSTSDPLAIRSVPVVLDPASPVVPAPAFAALAAQAVAQGITIATNGPVGPASAGVIRKALPQSYLDVTGARTGDVGASTDAFGCAIRATPPEPVTAPVDKTIRWGALISYALRQPVLAASLGLRYELSIPLDDPTTFAAGGWLFIDFAADDAWALAATPGQIRRYASRIPALAASRQIFAAVLFAVDASGTSFDDIATVEAETYDDGFAKIVHLNVPKANDAVVGDRNAVPAGTDVGIQIGWDDEAVITWQNRQLAMQNARAAGTLDAQSPLGVAGYRVDVADATGLGGPPALSAWRSLVNAERTLPGGRGTFAGELFIEPVPLRPRSSAADAWLPRYFATWRGGSLLTADPVPKALLDGVPVVPVPDPIGVLLSYGRTYAFRVRPADISAGGARRGDAPINDGPNAIATIAFKRHVPPKSPRIERTIAAGATLPERLTFFRPLIGYPEVLYTRLGATDADRASIVTFFTTDGKPGTGKIVGLPDPDATQLTIVVEVRTPIHDVAGDGEIDPPFRVLYRTQRPLPDLPAGSTPTDSGLTLDIAYVDAANTELWSKTQPPAGPLVLPRARELRISAYAVLRDDPVAIAPEATVGLSAQLTLRAESRDEPPLAIAPVDGQRPLRAFALRRPPDIAAPPVVAQLAENLALAVSGLTLSARPGERVVFGASKGVRTSLSSDAGSLTFASDSELLRQWVVAVTFDLERDWTWAGLVDGTFSIERDGETVGTARVPNVLSPEATANPANWDRSRTRVVFFDAIDPHEPTPSGFPQALTHTWRISATRSVESGPPAGGAGTPVLTGPLPAAGAELVGVEQKLVLPTTVAPAQIPELASVGIALSPFVADAGYASTQPRRRALWLELKAPIANRAGDALFARVVGHGADPLLYRATPTTKVTAEPPLVLDPELLREIIPGESDDRAGIDAMQQLERAGDSDVHFLLPLPPGIQPDSPELFGFYTYELRIGHAGDVHDTRWWSTANGRFGRPLRVSGVQHPAPPLTCRAGRMRVPVAPAIRPDGPARAGSTAVLIERLVTSVRATAPYATPVLDGVALVSPFQTPLTRMCFFLYAQVVQADGAANRNVLLLHRYGDFVGDADNARARHTARDRWSQVTISSAEIVTALHDLGLPPDLPLSMLAAELLPGGTAGYQANKPAAGPLATEADPLGTGLLGNTQRLLRVSPLVPVAAVC